MSDYTKLTDFASKDALPSGNANKIVKGTEIDDEFEAIETSIATKADLSSPTLTGTPLAPTAPVGTSTTQIATTAFVQGEVIPSGGIIMWSGVSVPTGWSLCDGTNSTPDLRNRFIVGSGDTYSTNDTGGSADAVVVSHTHTVTDPGHSHSLRGISSRQDTWNETLSDNGKVAGEDTGGVRNATGVINSATTGISIDSAGESGTNKNLPPYYALAFIMKD